MINSLTKMCCLQNCTEHLTLLIWFSGKCYRVPCVLMISGFPPNKCPPAGPRNPWGRGALGAGCRFPLPPPRGSGARPACCLSSPTATCCRRRRGGGEGRIATGWRTRFARPPASASGDSHIRTRNFKSYDGAMGGGWGDGVGMGYPPSLSPDS